MRKEINERKYSSRIKTRSCEFIMMVTLAGSFLIYIRGNM